MLIGHFLSLPLFRFVAANGISTVVLDRDPGQIENMRKVGFRSYYGDATRGSLLEAAGVEQAALFIVAIDEPGQAVLLVRELKRRCPQLRVLARAFDRGHHYQLRDAGADHVLQETHHSALELGTEALRSSGFSNARALQLRDTFEAVEREGHRKLYAAWQDTTEGERSVHSYRDLYMQLNEVMRDAMTDAESPVPAYEEPPEGRSG